MTNADAKPAYDGIGLTVAFTWIALGAVALLVLDMKFAQLSSTWRGSLISYSSIHCAVGEEFAYKALGLKRRFPLLSLVATALGIWNHAGLAIAVIVLLIARLIWLSRRVSSAREL